MESRALRYFLAIAEHRSFTSAAARIGVAQPALSAHIAKLELELGCKVFVRHPRGVTLTPGGEHLFREAVAILEHLRRAESETRAIGGQLREQCRFGLPPYAASVLTVPLMTIVEQVMPGVNLQIHEAMGGTLREWYSDGRLELAMLYRVPHEPLAQPMTVISEVFSLAAAQGVLGLPALEIGVDELLAMPLVVSTERNAHRQLLEAIARQRGTRLRVAAEIDSVSGQRKLVLMGMGAAVLPRGDFSDWPVERLDLVPVRPAEMSASLVVVRGSHVMENPTIIAVEQVLIDLVRRLVSDGSWQGVGPADQYAPDRSRAAPD